LLSVFFIWESRAKNHLQLSEPAVNSVTLTRQASSKCRREYDERIPNREPRGIEVPQFSVPPTSVANKDAWSAERPRGAFRVIRNPWGRRCQEREGLIVLDVAVVAGGDKAHLANDRNSNLKCRCEPSSPCYSNPTVFEFKCSRPASLPHQARSAQVSFPQKHSYVHFPFPVT
jgi:hypothetical protein